MEVSKEDEKAMNEAYKKAGQNAYFANGFYAGIEYSLNKEWISVNDRLPEKGQHIIFFDNSGFCFGWFSIDKAFTEKHRFGEGVTHWMKLPPPPNSKNK